MSFERVLAATHSHLSLSLFLDTRSRSSRVGTSRNVRVGETRVESIDSRWSCLKRGISVSFPYRLRNCGTIEKCSNEPLSRVRLSSRSSQVSRRVYDKTLSKFKLEFQILSSDVGEGEARVDSRRALRRTPRGRLVRSVSR